jgi:hypothetical protein
LITAMIIFIRAFLRGLFALPPRNIRSTVAGRLEPRIVPFAKKYN